MPRHVVLLMDRSAREAAGRRLGHRRVHHLGHWSLLYTAIAFAPNPYWYALAHWRNRVERTSKGAIGPRGRWKVARYVRVWRSKALLSRSTIEWTDKKRTGRT